MSFYFSSVNYGVSTTWHPCPLLPPPPPFPPFNCWYFMCRPCFSEWICCWLYYTRSPGWFSRELSEPEFSSRIFTLRFWEWFYVSGCWTHYWVFLLYLIGFIYLFVILSWISIVVSQDMAHGSQGLFTQVGFNDPSQDDAPQSHFGLANANPLQSQVSCLLNFEYLK